MSEMTANDIRSLDFWEDRWNTGRTGWHQTVPHPQLVSNAHLLLPKPDKYRVFVPLSGKSLDLIWLYSEGHHVVGVEGVEQAVQEFGKEHDLNMQVSTLQWGKLYQTPNKRLQIYVCDLFSLPPQEVGKFNAVWDRGSLVAINVEDRPRYATLMKQMLEPHFRYLLAVVDYTPNEQFSGPPCAVSTHEVEELFGDVAQSQLVEVVEKSDDSRYQSFGIDRFVENIFMLTPKAAGT